MSVVGFILTLTGIYLAWNQARRAASAAEAARNAVQRTQRQLRANQLLVLVPQLRWISTELDASIMANDRDLACRNLNNWRWQAEHIHGILSVNDPTEKRLLKKLQDSVGLAFAATGALLDVKDLGRPVMEDCRKAREAIGVVCNELSRWVGQASMTEPLEESSNG